jgi:hypothetical protein
MADAVQHIQHVKHIAPYVAPTIMLGYSMLTLVISNLSTAIVAGGLAWYIRGRGLAGVKIDLDNIKMDIANLKGKLSAQTPAAA